MAIEGALQDVDLPDIIQLLAMGRKTGCLTVTDRSNFGYVYFREGRVVYASVLNRPDRLGELLVRNGAITREQLSEAMEAQSEDRGARLGELLVRVGIIDEETLGRFIRIQLEEAVYHLFTWTQGSFHFDSDQVPDESELYLVDLPAENLLLEGARRVDEWGLIQKKVPSFDLVFSLKKDPQGDPDVELTEHQRRILPLLDGVRSVDDLVHESGLVEFDVGKALFGLIQAGFVERSGSRTRAEGGDSEVEEHLALGIAFYRSKMFEDAAREFEAVLEREPANPRALHRMGLIALRSRRYSAALDWFDRIPTTERDGFAVQRNRALAFELLDRPDEGLEALEVAERARPSDPETMLSRGILLLRKGDVPGALEAFRGYRTSPAVKRPSPLYYAYTVLAAGMADQLEYAVAVGREGLGHYPESAAILVNTGAVLERRTEAEAAAALYSRAVGRYPAPAQAHKALGDQARERGEAERARMHYEKAVKVDPRLGDDVYHRLAAIAHADEDLDVARLLWRRALELNPGNTEVRERLDALDAEG